MPSPSINWYHHDWPLRRALSPWESETVNKQRNRWMADPLTSVKHVLFWLLQRDCVITGYDSHDTIIIIEPTGWLMPWRLFDRCHHGDVGWSTDTRGVPTLWPQESKQHPDTQTCRTLLSLVNTQRCRHWIVITACGAISDEAFRGDSMFSVLL